MADSYSIAALDPRFQSRVSPAWKNLRELEAKWSEEIAQQLKVLFGEISILHAWEDFNLGKEVPFPETHEEYESDRDFESLFMVWFTFNWVPDREENSLAYQIAVDLALSGEDLEIGKGGMSDSLFLLSVANAPFSFHQVIQVDRDAGTILLRDLFLGTEALVSDLNASATMQVGTVLYGKVVRFSDDAFPSTGSPETIHLLVGVGSMAIPTSFLPSLLELRRKIQGKRKKVTSKLLLENEDELRGTYLDIREVTRNPSPPILTNTDGELLEPRRLRAELSEELEVVARKLQPLYGRPIEEILEDSPKDASGRFSEIAFPWLKQDGQNAETGNTVLGRLKLLPGVLEIEVNSKQRAARIDAEIKKLLGTPKLLFKVEDLEPPKIKMPRNDGVASLESARFQSEQARMLADPSIRSAVEKLGQKHWKEWPDIPLPALRGLTPRQAAHDPEGRELLEAVLLDFEGSKGVTPSAALMQPDVGALRHELGLHPKRSPKGGKKK